MTDYVIDIQNGLCCVHSGLERQIKVDTWPFDLEFLKYIAYR